MKDSSWRKAAIGAEGFGDDQSGRSVQLGRTKEENEHRISVDLNLPAYQIIHWRAALKNSDSGRCDESVPVEAVQQYPWLLISAFAGITWESFRTIYRRCCH